MCRSSGAGGCALRVMIAAVESVRGWRFLSSAEGLRCSVDGFSRQHGFFLQRRTGMLRRGPSASRARSRSSRNSISSISVRPFCGALICSFSMSSAFKKNAGIGCIPGKSFGFRFRFGTDRLRRPALAKPEFRGPSNCSWPLSSARNDGDSQIFNNHRCFSNGQVGKQIEYSKKVPAIAAKMRVSRSRPASSTTSW